MIPIPFTIPSWLGPLLRVGVPVALAVMVIGYAYLEGKQSVRSDQAQAEVEVARARADFLLDLAERDRELALQQQQRIADLEGKNRELRAYADSLPSTDRCLSDGDTRRLRQLWTPRR